MIAVAFGLLHHFVGRRNFFQQASEMLLLNILPKEISELLKTQPRTIADIVGFTPMVATMTPLSLVDLLNDECFDTLVDQYDLEKIKTGEPRSVGGHLVGAGWRFGSASIPAQRSRALSAAKSLSTILGRDRKHDEPHGVARPKRRYPDHAQDL